MPRVLYETHSHTTLCKHAVGTPQDYAAKAWQRGLAGLVVTCHNPLPDGISASVRMEDSEFPLYVEIVAEAREIWAGRVDVRLGLEADYLPGLESWTERLLNREPFHYVIGSVHPHIREYQERFFHGDWIEFHRGYYRHLAEAAETGLYDSLGHPDIVKNLGSEWWDISVLMPDICRALDRIAATGVAMELNTSGVHKKVREMNPAPAILEKMREREIPVVIGADAHEPARVGEGFLTALDLLEQAGYREVSYFLERRRRTVPLSEARASLIAAEEDRSVPNG